MNVNYAKFQKKVWQYNNFKGITLSTKIMLFADSHIPLQTGYYCNWWESLETLTQTIWLGLYEVSVFSLCGHGPAAASLSMVNSRGCIASISVQEAA